MSADGHQGSSFLVLAQRDSGARALGQGRRQRNGVARPARTPDRYRTRQIRARTITSALAPSFHLFSRITGREGSRAKPRASDDAPHRGLVVLTMVPKNPRWGYTLSRRSFSSALLVPRRATFPGMSQLP